MTFFYSINDGKSDYGGSSLDGSEDSIGTLIASSPRSGTSLDRSSVNSIPWADEAIKQNQNEWEKIENIFYGEEPLPNDEKMHEEFVEWMTAFPHLRIVGKSMPYYYDSHIQKYDENYEEIFAIDPPIKQDLIARRPDQYKVVHSNNTSNNTNNASQRFEDRYFGKSLTHRNSRQRDEINLNILSRELTQYLKITPSPILNRRLITTDKTSYQQHDPNLARPYLLKVPNSNSNALQIVELNPDSGNKINQNSYSASHIRMPPIFSIKFFDEQPPTRDEQQQNVSKLKSATTIGQLKTRVTLPAIDVKHFQDKVPLSYRSINTGGMAFGGTANGTDALIGRSISPMNKNIARNKNYSKSASKVKIIKFN